ncbi:MAG: hypothetical protein ACKN9V_02165 [Pseudomonadota bacterium]
MSSNLFKVLEKMVEIHGVRVFTQLTQTEMAQGLPDPTIVPSLPEFWDRSRMDLDYFSLFLKKNLGSIEIFSPLETLKIISELLAKGMGFISSLIVPQQDIRLPPRHLGADTVYIHRPGVILISLLIQWIKEMLILAESHPDLSQLDKRAIIQMRWALNHFGNGFQSGVYRKELVIKFIQSIRSSVS